MAAAAEALGVELDPEFAASVSLAVDAAKNRAELRGTIKPCPICGSVAFMVWEPVWAVVCSGGKCGIRLERPFGHYPPDHTSLGVLISRWNDLPRFG
jgi:hypothetical protein